MTRQASRHQGIKASRLRIDASRRVRFCCLDASMPRCLGAFSLIEVLLAVFILGIGVVSIAALFPAGIAQQQKSNDDIIGPIVANNALSILRTKLDQDDFGTFEEFSLPGTPVYPTYTTTGVTDPIRTLPGDWPWMRPSVLLDDDNSATDPTVVVHPATPPGETDFDDSGSIDIFSWYETTGTGTFDRATEFAGGHPDNPALLGIPFNTTKYAGILPDPPRIVITQWERYYPMVSRQYVDASAGDAPDSQYVWDCMFRRFQGRIFVAIFVYRVNTIGGSGGNTYTVPRNYIQPLQSDFPFIPYRLDLDLDPVSGGAPYYSAGENWDTAEAGGADNIDSTRGDESIVYGNSPGVLFNHNDPNQAWQDAGQWLIDQNNNIHRVVTSGPFDVNDNQFVDDTSSPFIRGVELMRPVNPVLGWGNTIGSTPEPTLTPYFYLFNPGSGLSSPPTVPIHIYENVVTHIWYIPLEVDLDGDDVMDVSLTTVYATVKEL